MDAYDFSSPQGLSPQPSSADGYIPTYMGPGQDQTDRRGFDYPSFDRPNVLEGLNEAQREAVVHQGAPLLIVAGAGSGKTRVLTHRIAYQLQKGALRPSEVLAITFTNKAAAEMQERVHALIEPGGGYIWVSTFHSACVRILREHAKAAGLKSNFSIYDAQDSQRLIGMILKDEGVDTKRFNARFVASRISDLKNELISPAQYAKDAPADPVSQMVVDVYKEYNKRLRTSNALDFDDLIMVTVQMLQSHPAVLERYHRRFKEILVDEYQDTNHAQYVLVRTLVGDGSDGVPPAQLTVVGDSDQSIYAFRGASIRNIEEFEKDFDNARTVLLEQNYRSTQNILDAANAVISQNRGRRPKRLWTALGAGDLVGVGGGDDEYDEARFVVGEIQKIMSSGVNGGDIAIFYRTNAQSRVLEEMLMAAPIPYRLVGGVRFYDRAEIKDALAYLQAISNPDDTVALRRIINTPRRGIGDKAQAAIAAHADRYGISFGEAIADTLAGSERTVEGIATRARNSAAEFWSLLEEMRQKDASGVPPHEILEEVLERTGYLEGLRASNDPQDAVREDNLADLVSSATEFANWSGQGGVTLGAFLERTALVSDADQVPSEDGRLGQVTLMTVHTAKGLEFPYVFVTGLEDGTFPHKRSMDDESEVAEEHRLAYVALTRARERLYLTRAAARRSWGTTEYLPPSRFLDHIPEEVTETLLEPSAPSYGGYGSSQSGGQGDYQPAFWDDTWSVPPRSKRSRGHESSHPDADLFGDDRHVVGSGRSRRRTSGVRPLGTTPVSSQSTDENAPMTLKIGDRVQHATLGEGVVVGLEGSGRSTVVRVEFSAETKRLLLRMAPLSKI